MRSTQSTRKFVHVGRCCNSKSVDISVGLDSDLVQWHVRRIKWELALNSASGWPLSNRTSSVLPCGIQVSLNAALDIAVSLWNSDKAAFDTCKHPVPPKIHRRACFVSQGEANHSAETPCDTCSPDTVKLENLHWPSAVRRSVKWMTPFGNSMPRHGAGGSGGAGFGGLGAVALTASLRFAACLAFPPRPIEPKSRSTN